MTWRSFWRKKSSPSRVKISAMVMLAAASISASESRNPTPRICATARPTAVFPAPIMPTITTLLRSFQPITSTGVFHGAPGPFGARLPFDDFRV